MAAALRLQAAARMLQRSPAEHRRRRYCHGSSTVPRLSLLQLHERQQELSEELYPVLLELDKRILGKHYKARGLRRFRSKVRCFNGCEWAVSLGFLHCVCFHDLTLFAAKETPVEDEEDDVEEGEG
ncbi:hypothetical protein VPH35_017521 [Triticum aestivum]